MGLFKKLQKKDLKHSFSVPTWRLINNPNYMHAFSSFASLRKRVCVLSSSWYNIVEKFIYIGLIL